MRTLLLASCWLLAAVAASRAEDSPTPEQLLPQAQKLAEQKPTAAHWIGLSEMQRAAGQAQESLDTLLHAAATPAGRDDAGLRGLICWRMIPVGTGDHDEFRPQLALLKEKGLADSWAGVYDLFLACARGDRAALIAAAADGKTALKAFPTDMAEKAHLDLLVELGLPRTQAGLEVVAARTYENLYVLRDLDRWLSREAGFLRTDGRDADAKTLESCRDQLREAYLSASRRLVERLFALNLLSRAKERAALLADAETVPYLSDRQKMQAALARLDEGQAWSLIVEPLLTDEVRLIEAPPDLAKVKAPAAAELAVQADRKTVREGTVVYEGGVKVSVGAVRIACDRLSLVRDGDAGPAVLAGSGGASVEGLPGFPGGVRADRFTYSTDVGSFTLGGEVRLGRADGVLKLRACTINRAGAVGDRRSLLDDFHDADTAGRLDLLSRISKVYSDDELPGEVRFLLALSLLRPHLSWHAPYAPPKRDEKVESLIEKAERESNREDARWAPAHGGEDWMLADVPKEVRDALRKALEAAPGDQLEKTRQGTFFWHIKDRDHPDNARAIRLLEGVNDGDDAGRARRWLADVRRDNTVLTFDVTGGYASGKDAPVVLDARAADKVTFKLYRIRNPEDLVWVEDRIGRDFIYRDHGLQYGEPPHMPLMDKMREATGAAGLRSKTHLKDPDFLKQEPAARWDSRPGDLKALPIARREQPRERDWNDEGGEAGYFGDDCSEFRQRLDKSYRPDDGAVSSWQCDRIVEVPGKELAEPGAYVLAVEANGETSYAPLLVDPLSLTLRRSRDGVFALVSDHEGKKPVAGARIIGKEMLGDAVADAEGAAFARVFAAGDRAVIAYRDGRYAIGGFGRVFDGVYESPLDENFREGRRRWADAKRGEEKSQAMLYADRYVVAALTDRPTYRPGQEVQFKLIVRRLAPPEKADDARPRVFRAEDFDLASHLRLPDNGTQVPYELIDPKGRVVANGTLTLNDFGTAAGKAVLNGEAAVGAYSFRVNIGAVARLVPEAFAVKYYRVPNFEVEVGGVADKMKEVRELSLEVTSRYYFGKAVAGGKAEARLVQPDEWKPLAEAEAVLDDDGKATLKLKPGKDLGGGAYTVICDVTDDSGRTVSRSLPLQVDGPAAAVAGLAALPRFVPAGTALHVPTMAAEVVAEQWFHDDKANSDRSRGFTFTVQDGEAVVQPPTPGWYTLTAGQDETEIFVYGDKGDPFQTWTKQKQERRDQDKEKAPRPMRKRVPRWVDLSHYRSEDDGEIVGGVLARPPLLALFDRHQARVGDKLRVLVYTPVKNPRLVLTMEGWTVVDYFVADPTDEAGDYHVLEIPIRARESPNCYLQGEIVSGDAIPFFDVPYERVQELEQDRKEGEGEDPLWCRVDVIDPNPTPGGETLKIDVKTDRKEYKPGDAVDVEVRVVGPDGKPREAEASLTAIDEGVYAFGEDRAAGLARLFSDPHPPQRYARKTWRASQGDRWEIEVKRLEEWHKHPIQMEKMEQAAQEAKAGLDGGARGLANLSPARLVGEMPAASVPAGRLRMDFRETAAWLPQLRTGADGVAKASFKLPDSLTEYRVTAVALTKETEIGVGRASVRTTLPLAAQLMLPRFAVEQDHLTAVGLVHNNSPRDRVCTVAWEVEGAAVDGPETPLDGWKQDAVLGKVLGRGRLAVAAGQSARVGLRLRMDHIGSVKVVFRCEDGADSDGETRTLPVEPLGREREVIFDGSFKAGEKVMLPAGFTARELNVVVARGDAARSLEGVGGLVDYPYGCVEQTMSRFLPAVAVQHATRETALQLPPEVTAKLPDVLSKGLTRLYHFQHDDGGWGWWEKDATDARMTAYVIYGLSRCRMAGVPVDADVLDRSCVWLRRQLDGDALLEPLASRAWFALALAGREDKAALDKLASQAIDSPETRCTLALACRAAGLSERGERLWASVRDWRPEGVDPLALKLRAALAFGAPLDECQADATRLVALRSGLGWGSTQETADAIDALAGMTGYVADKAPARSVRVLVGGKAILDVKDGNDLKKMVYRVRLNGDRAPAGEGLTVEMAADCDEPVYYTVVASGVQRLDKVEPVGKEIKVERRLETLDGKPLEGKVRVGQVFAVRLTVDLEKPQDYVIVQDRRPAGCEYADERIARQDAVMPANVEFRDDRVCIFYGGLSAGRHEIVYYLRAETPGAGHMLPACVFPMYSESVRGETGSTMVEVEARGP